MARSDGNRHLANLTAAQRTEEKQRAQSFHEVRQQRSAGEQKAAHGDNPLKTKPGNVLPATHVTLPASAHTVVKPGAVRPNEHPVAAPGARVPTAPARPAPPTARPGQHLPGTTEPTAHPPAHPGTSPAHPPAVRPAVPVARPAAPAARPATRVARPAVPVARPRPQPRDQRPPRRDQRPPWRAAARGATAPPRLDRPQQLDPRRGPPPRLDRLPEATGSKVNCRVPIQAPTGSTGSSLSSNDLWFAHWRESR